MRPDRCCAAPTLSEHTHPQQPSPASVQLSQFDLTTASARPTVSSTAGPCTSRAATQGRKSVTLLGGCCFGVSVFQIGAAKVGL